jgi:ADP-heptose:LPS heptosyltransferase
LKLNFRRGSAFASKRAKAFLADKKPEDIKNITVIRHAAIGDFMNIRPFLIEMREFFPNAKITISLLGSATYGYPEDLVDATHIVHKEDPNDKTKKTNLFERIKQIKQLPPQDILFDLTDSTLTAMMMFFADAKLKIGYPYRSIRRLFCDIATLRSDMVVEAQSVLHMLNILGVKTSRELRYGLEERYPKTIKKRIVYFAGASMDAKCWEKEKFKDAIDKLSDEFKDYEHVILQGIGEHEKFLEIYEPLQDKLNVVLQEKLSLEDVMHFLAQSSLLVSNDTGVRNMAIATQTPTVGIFFMIPPFRYWPREEKHDCVYNIEYTSPDVDAVVKSASDIVNNLYEK